MMDILKRFRCVLGVKNKDYLKVDTELTNCVLFLAKDTFQSTPEEGASIYLSNDDCRVLVNFLLGYLEDPS